MPIKPPIFKPVINPIGPEIKYSERLRRVIKAHEDLGFEYQLSTKEIRGENLFSIYAQKYPDMVRRKLMGLHRVKLKEPNMFEFEDDTLDSENKIKEVLVFSESRKVLNPKNLQVITEAFIHSTIVDGIYRKPFATVDKDEWGNLTEKTKISGYTNVFYIPFTPKNAQKVLDKFNGKYRNTTLAYATQGENWFQTPTFSVPSLQDWLTEDFELLVKANMAGTLMEEPGGVDVFLKKERDRKHEIMKEVEESGKVRALSKSRK